MYSFTIITAAATPAGWAVPPPLVGAVLLLTGAGLAALPTRGEDAVGYRLRMGCAAFVSLCGLALF